MAEKVAVRPAGRDVLVEFLRRPRYEVIPLAGVEDAVAAHVPKEVKLTVTASPKQGLEATLRVTEALAREGYQVVPHLSARLVVDEAHVGEILQRLDELGVREAFVIAGDVKSPAGKFGGAAALLAAMAQVGHRLDEIGVTGYPESHPFISDEMTIRAMFEKEPYATYIVSQISFDPEIIRSWVERVRRRGVELPIHIGIAGPIDRVKLLRISMRIGLGESARFLRWHGSWFGRLLLPAAHTPDGLVEALTPSVAVPENKIGGFHFYTFNEVEKTEEWRREALGRLGVLP